MKSLLFSKSGTVVFLLSLLLTFSATAQETALLGWVKNMGGSDGDSGEAIAVDADGNVYTTGYFRNTGDFDPGPGTLNLTSAGIIDIFISKVDADGNLVWALRFGGNDYDRGFGIDVDGNGNVYCAGYFSSTVDFDLGPGTANLSTSDTDFFVLKLDSDGNFIWVKGIGGSGGDYARALTVDDAQNVYIMGEFRFTVDFDPGPGVTNLTQTGSNGDVFILKLNAAGDYVWAARHGGASDDVARSIKVDAAGNVYSTGGFYGTVDFDPGAGIFELTSAGTDDAFVSKLDLNGNFVWAKSIGSTGIDRAQGLVLDGSSNVYVTGHFSGTVDFDPGAGAFALTSQQHDAFTLKLDTNGDFVWAKVISGTSFDENYTIAADDEGDVYIGGKTYGTIDFDPGPGVFNLEANGDYIVKLDTDGNFEWAITYEGTSMQLGMGITVDNTDNVYITGQFFKADFDPGACVHELTSTATDIYVLKLTQGLPAPGPTITSINPSQGSPGNQVIITGTNFDPVAANNIVMFNGTIAQVNSATLTSITVTVPAGASDGHISVIANCITTTSADVFTIGEAGIGLIVYNAVSPNDDTKNDFFRVENIEIYASNKVTIYNRWGDVVFDVSNYDNTDRVFKGVSNSGKELPSGIYYYKIEFSSGRKARTGYLSLRR